MSLKRVVNVGTPLVILGIFGAAIARGTGAPETVGNYVPGLHTYGPYDVRRNPNWVQFRYGMYDLTKVREEGVFGFLLCKLIGGKRSELIFQILPFKPPESAFEFLESQRIGNVRYIDWAYNYHPCYKPEAKFEDTVEVPYNYRYYYGQINTGREY